LSSPENPQFDSQAPLNVESQPGLLPDPPSSALFPPAPSLLTPALEPPRDPVWNGWDVLLIFLLSFVALIVTQVMVVFGAQRFFYRREDLEEVGLKPGVLLLAQLLLYPAVAAMMFLFVEGKYHVRFWQAIRWHWPRAGWRYLGLGALLMFALALLQNVLPMPKDTPFDKLFARPRDAYLIALISVTLAPLIEEILFRGLLYPVLARRLGVVWGIVFTALPFGLLHMQQYGYAWSAVFIIFLVGVACTAVRAFTRSVAASFLVHVGYNGTQMILAIAITHGFRQMEKAGILWAF
jgi:membrane protease YdiL (CAAX protease family)